MDFVVQFVICYYLMLGYGVYLAFKGFKREDWYLKPDDRFVLKNEQGSNSTIYRFIFAQSYKEIRLKNTQDNSNFLISHDQLLKDYKPLV